MFQFLGKAVIFLGLVAIAILAGILVVSAGYYLVEEPHREAVQYSAGQATAEKAQYEKCEKAKAGMRKYMQLAVDAASNKDGFDSEVVTMYLNFSLAEGQVALVECQR